MIRKLGFLTGLLVLTGCSAFLATSQDLYYHDEVFAPRRTSDEVALFRDARPRIPYLVLGRIVATQGMFGSRESVLAELRRQAAAMGADALVDLTEGLGSRSGSEGEPSTSELTRYDQAGNVSTSESWIQDPRASIRLTISGLAIRYQQP